MRAQWGVCSPYLTYCRMMIPKGITKNNCKRYLAVMSTYKRKKWRKMYRGPLVQRNVTACQMILSIIPNFFTSDEMEVIVFLTQVQRPQASVRQEDVQKYPYPKSQVRNLSGNGEGLWSTCRRS